MYEINNKTEIKNSKKKQETINISMVVQNNSIFTIIHNRECLFVLYNSKSYLTRKSRDSELAYIIFDFGSIFSFHYTAINGKLFMSG